MFKSPTSRYVLRTALVGVASALASLQANLPGVSGDDVVQAVIAGAILALGYAGIGAVTPAEPRIGKKS